MLAAIIANLQNVQPGPNPTPPMVKIDRGGAGPQWPGYQIVDIQQALYAFQEIPGEHPVARAVRRQKHIGDYLEALRRQRAEHEQIDPSNAMAIGLMWGATLERMRQAEEDEAKNVRAAITAELAKIRAEEAAAAELARRRDRDAAIGTAVFAGLVGGLALAVIIKRARA